jgi:hypothetical protein
MAQRIQVRRGTAAQWTTADPTLASGEIGYETDTAEFKIGDGSSEWSALPYFDGGGGDDTDVAGYVNDPASATTTALAAQYAPLPSGTPTVGQVPVVTDDDPLALGWGAGGGGGGAVDAIDGSFSTVSVGPSSTTETTIYSHAIAAGEPQLGDVYRLRMMGQVRNASGSSQTMIWRIKLGATTVITTESVTISNGPNGFRNWVLDVDIPILSATSQRMAATWLVSVPTLSNASTMSGVAGSWAGYSTATEDTSAPVTLEVTVQLGASNGSYFLDSHAAYLTRTSGF